MARAVFGSKSQTSNTRQSGVSQGTPGGIPAAGKRPGMKIQVGDEVYLWFLVFLELLAMVGLRNYFRTHHGG